MIILGRNCGALLSIYLISSVLFFCANCCRPFSRFSYFLASHLGMSASHNHQYSNKTAYGIKSDALRYSWAGYHLFILISSLVGDTAILIASLRYRAINLHKVIVVIMQHIAFSDLMVTITVVIPRIVSLTRDQWVLGEFMCYLTIYTNMYFNLTSLLLICNMTASKLLLLKYPFRCSTISMKKAHMICGACWLAAHILPVSALLVTALYRQAIYFSYRNYDCYRFGSVSVIWNWLKPISAIIFIFTPNCLVVASTIYLVIIAKKVARRGRESLKWQGILTTVLTATVYCISVLPAIVYGILESIIIVDDQSTSFFHTSYLRIAYSFLYLNTISNFYIYSLSVKSFRDFIRSRILQTYQTFTCIEISTIHGR